MTQGKRPSKETSEKPVRKSDEPKTIRRGASYWDLGNPYWVGSYR